MNQKTNYRKRELLKHPVTILVSVGIGVVIGLYNRQISALVGIANFAEMFTLPGELYLYYIQMTVIPIIITAIASSLGKLMRNKDAAGLIKRLGAVFVLCLIFTAIIGVAFGAIGKPGSGLDENNRTLLSRLISGSGTGNSGAMELSLSPDGDAAAPGTESGLYRFFKALIPSNIFNALGSGSIMAIVFFSIIFGVAIGFLKDESAVMLIDLLSALFEAFQNLISWSLYALPFGIICLMAGQIAQIGIGVFLAMSKFILIYGIGTVFLFVISTLAIWLRSGIANPFRILQAVFEPILLAFATRNSMATLPGAIFCLDEKLDFSKSAVSLTLPLGMTLARFGNIFYFGIAVFFVVEIYGMQLEMVHYPMIAAGIIFAGTATAGASGIVTLSVISIVLNILSLPGEAILIILMAIDPIIDPLRTFQLVYMNMAATALIARPYRGSSPPETVQAKPDQRELLDNSAFDGITFDDIKFDFIKRELDILSGDIVKQYGRGIIVNEDTYQRYQDRFEFRRLDRIAADDRSEGFTIYEVYSVKGNIKESIKKLFAFYETGLRCYFDQDFKTAYKYFNTVHKNLPSDMPSKVMLERCVRYAKDPPRNWDGTTAV
jgi:proton glutamate symport protein